LNGSDSTICIHLIPPMIQLSYPTSISFCILLRSIFILHLHKKLAGFGVMMSHSAKFVCVIMWCNLCVLFKCNAYLWDVGMATHQESYALLFN